MTTTSLAAVLVLAFSCVLSASCLQVNPEAHDMASPASELAEPIGGWQLADLVCADTESTAEVQEPVGTAAVALAFICALGMYIVVHHFCEEGDYFTNQCPPGAYRVIVDVWDKTKKVLISCDTLKVLCCGTSQVAGDAALVKLCGHIL